MIPPLTTTLDELRDLVDAQSKDQRLWAEPITGLEGHLQRALLRLQEAIDAAQPPPPTEALLLLTAAVTLLRRWLSAWRAIELGPPRADLVAATSRFVHSQEATDDLPVATPALDVERLARAIDASWADLLAPLGGQSEGLLRIAEKVAAEYARLGQPVAEDCE